MSASEHHSLETCATAPTTRRCWLLFSLFFISSVDWTAPPASRWSRWWRLLLRVDEQSYAQFTSPAQKFLNSLIRWSLFYTLIYVFFLCMLLCKILPLTPHSLFVFSPAVCPQSRPVYLQRKSIKLNPVSQRTGTQLSHLSQPCRLR